MDIVIWVNTLFLIIAAVVEGIILYAVLKGGLKKRADHIHRAG